MQSNGIRQEQRQLAAARLCESVQLLGGGAVMDACLGAAAAAGGRHNHTLLLRGACGPPPKNHCHIFCGPVEVSWSIHWLCRGHVLCVCVCVFSWYNCGRAPAPTPQIDRASNQQQQQQQWEGHRGPQQAAGLLSIHLCVQRVCVCVPQHRCCLYIPALLLSQLPGSVACGVTGTVVSLGRKQCRCVTGSSHTLPDRCCRKGAASPLHE